MPELNIDVDYFEHPKVVALCDLVGGDWAEIVPIRLWRFVAKYAAETGELTGLLAHGIERAIKWRGKKGEGVGYLVQCGFLDVMPNGYRVHGWDERQGHIAAGRDRARNAAKARWDKFRARGDPKSDAPSIATSNAQASVEQSPCLVLSSRDESCRVETNGKHEFGPPEDLAQRFRFFQRGRKEVLDELADAIGEMLRIGYDAAVLRAEIDRPDRDRTERFWKLQARLEKAKRPSGESRLSGTAAWLAEKEREEAG